MDEEWIPITANPRKNDSCFQESGRFVDPNCTTIDGKNCTAMYVMYEITWKLSKHENENYIGMTTTSSHCRMVYPLSGYRTKGI